MNVAIRESIRLLCVSLAHLWYWNREGEGRWFTAFVYPKDLDTQLRGRIKITIELEADPVAKQREYLGLS